MIELPRWGAVRNCILTPSMIGQEVNMVTAHTGSQHRGTDYGQDNPAGRYAGTGRTGCGGRNCSRCPG